eukprot:TRINITY_DN5233_c0_g1_i1.p1 TRINITY_DN5233_c0_g1~~TRINITY_DN5233_c0_g1_i1.p1  ORF type:complete len:222 (+),score=34.54 TRINITY_DN5233_c0_g1_i1:146-811(+)
MTAPTVRVVPVRTPYLHPSQRNLKADQIGPSSHKNQYNVGVLQSNWVEDRAALEDAPQRSTLDAVTVMKASFQPPGVNGRSDPIPSGEMDRPLLFGHGDFHQTRFLTMNELFYQDPFTTQGSLKTEVACKVEGYSNRSSYAETKRAQWRDAAAQGDSFQTTKNATIDASGDLAKMELSNSGFRSTASSKWGNSVRDLSADYHKTGLRQPVTYSRTPLVSRR